MTSTIVYLSDCTPLYTTLGAPDRITSVVGSPLHRSVRLEWQLPPNSDKVVVDSYIIRYKLTTAPTTQVLNEFVSFFPTFIVTGLSNGVSYDFWVAAKNRFGESPHSPTISLVPIILRRRETVFRILVENKKSALNLRPVSHKTVQQHLHLPCDIRGFLVA